MTEPFLVTQWAVCGIAAAAARFVPVPLLDDVVRERALQVAVSRTLHAHGRDYSSDLLEPLWGEHDEGGSKLRRRLKSAGLKVLFFPVRKYRAVFGAVRGVPNDVMRVVLLARALDRRLDAGGLTDRDRVPAESRELRRAVEAAVHGMDLKLLTAALSDGLSQGRGLTTAAVAFARSRFSKPDVDRDLDPSAPVAEGAERVAAALRRPEVQQLLDRFDSRVDTALAS
jgi:hypothetical protein